MITLDQAIKLATEAHEGQWRKSSVIQTTIPIEEVIKAYPNCTVEPTFLRGTYNISNKPYITHPLAVMKMMNTDEEKIIAVLHDVFEDNKNFTLNHNRPIKESIVQHWIQYNSEKYYITPNIYDALFLLTKSNKVTYTEYMDSITISKLAIKIKIADMIHNMSESNNPTQKLKYLEALPILLKEV